MTDKQYADMTTIMQFCRIFADQMQMCLEHSGLVEQGYSLRLHVDQAIPNGDTEDLVTTIELAKDIQKYGWEEYSKQSMIQIKTGEERWMNFHDPRTEAGSIPTEVCYKERRTFREAVAEERAKPYPPDGLWIGADYRGSDVDYRRD